jgi:hypothetical protein
MKMRLQIARQKPTRDGEIFVVTFGQGAAVLSSRGEIAVERRRAGAVLRELRCELFLRGNLAIHRECAAALGQPARAATWAAYERFIMMDLLKTVDAIGRSRAACPA